jgi:hypothetical protein
MRMFGRFRRQRKSHADEPLSLAARAERMRRIIDVAANDAESQQPGEISALFGNPELMAAFETVGSMPDEQLAEFLDMLETGCPKKFKHLLQ